MLIVRVANRRKWSDGRALRHAASFTRNARAILMLDYFIICSHFDDYDLYLMMKIYPPIYLIIVVEIS